MADLFSPDKDVSWLHDFRIGEDEGVKYCPRAHFVNSVVPREQLEAETMKHALACARNRSTDTVFMQKTFFEVFRQQQGEYMGSIPCGWLEAMLPAVRSAGEMALDEETFGKGLSNAVKDNDSQYPADWRLSYSGRKPRRKP